MRLLGSAEWGSFGGLRRAGAIPVALAAVVAASACTVVGTTAPRPPVRVVVGPVPEGPPPDAGLGGLDPVRRFDEVRALWVVRYTMTSAESIRAMVRHAEDAGINTLIVQVRGRADAFYASGLEPRGESIQEAAGFDPLQLVLDQAHPRGIAVHAWVNTHLVWGPAAPPRSPEHLLHAHPDWLAVPRSLAAELSAVDPTDDGFVARLVRFAEDNPETVEGLYTSPSHPAVQERVHGVWMDLATRYDLDGIHFDYIRYPSSEYDYSIGGLERFRTWVRGRLPEPRFAELDAAYERDLFAFTDGEAALWAEFRREQVTRLVTRIRADVKAIKPRLTVSAAVIADPDVAYADRFQDWQTWLREGWIDVAVPMAYTPDAHRFEGLVRAARRAAPSPERVWAGIGAYMTTPQGTVEMIDIARAEDAGGIAIFSYDWAVGEGQSDREEALLRRIGRERFGR
jgi:uncharacterized lipoprotein YddW (UPF0748 family)